MKIGHRLRSGEVIELIGDIGSGKTSFVRGLATGMGSGDQVRSPSFTLSNQYKANGLTLHHFDFYRLKEPGIMRQELVETLEDPEAAVVIEWSGIVENVLPDKRITIHIKATSETGRQINFSCPKTLGYLNPDNT